MQESPPLIGMDRELIGTTLAGWYQIERLIARGGMGRLYLAVQQPLGRTVVIKVMTLPQVLNTDGASLQARFFREAATCARLRHPNTVTLFDYGELSLEDGKTFYMVMEHIEGRNLDQVLHEEGRLSPARALRIGMEIVRSLREAHQLGVVHRDLKPSNVMLVDTPEGEQVKVLDFGIAKVMADAADAPEAEELTRQSDIVGSPSYMSPEQVLHHPIDARSDVYSLGALLFHLIAGRRPFRAHSATMRMMAHVHRPTPSLRATTNEDFPVAVDALLQRCMAKAPEDRYPHAEALLDALRETLEQVRDLPPPAPLARADATPAAEEATLHPAQEHTPTDTAAADGAGRGRAPLLAALTLGVIVLLVLPALGVAGVGVWWLTQPATPTVTTAPDGPSTGTEPPPQQPVLREVTLQSSPTGATVREGEAVLGQTPLTLTVPADAAAPRTFTLEAADHLPAELTWDPTSATPPAPITLTPAPPKPTRSPTTPASAGRGGKASGDGIIMER